MCESRRRTGKRKDEGEFFMFPFPPLKIMKCQHFTHERDDECRRMRKKKKAERQRALHLISNITTLQSDSLILSLKLSFGEVLRK